MKVRPSFLVGLLGALACAPNPQFEPPEFPAHEISEGGAMHAFRFEFPFNCGTDADPDSKDETEKEKESNGGVPCIDRPDDDRALSCDTLLCHGGFEYDGTPESQRDLLGSDGPSCYTCHGEKWQE